MKLRLNLSDERLAQGFTQQNDIFQLADLSKRLTSLIRALSQGSVSILDGRWGTGKTTFVKMWVAHLEQEGVPAIYFDAFGADYIQDPFQAISSAFIRAAMERKRTNEPAYQRYLARAASAAKRLAGVTVKAGVKLASLGALGAAEINEISDIADDISEAAGDISEEVTKALLERHASNETQFSALRQSLLELPELFRPVDASDPPSPLPLVVVIDELDRCRPDFALGIIEILKHFFRVDNLHFILVTNMQHLSLSISQRYGLSSAAHEYLQKFYDFVIHFEHRYDKHNDTSIGIFVSKLFNELVPESISFEDRRNVEDHIKALSRAYQLSLRQIESVVSNIALSLLASRPREFRPTLILCVLCLIKSIRPNIYLTAKTGSFDYHLFSDFIRQGKWDGSIDVQRVLLAFRYYSDVNIDEKDQQFSGFGRGLWEYSLDRLEVIPYLANSIVDRFGKA